MLCLPALMTQCSAKCLLCYKLKPKIHNAYFFRGLAYYKKGQYDQAIDDLNKVIESGLMSTSVYFYRGSAYFFKDEYSKAIDDYTKAIELDANNSSVYQSSVYQLRGIAYYKKGEYDKAWEDVQKSQELGGEIDSEVLNVIREASGN